MARTQSGRLGVFGAIALLVVAVIATFAVIWGPKLVREGRAIGGPILEMARAEKRLEALDQELPFTPPESGVIPAQRLEAFLDLREDLRPRYETWQDLVGEVERRGEDDWATAREVIIATRDVIMAQIEGLEEARMSKAEFQWLEQQVYADWLDGGVADPAEARLLEATEDDLAYLDELEDRTGTARAVEEMRARLEARRDELRGDAVAPGPNDALLEAHRDRIAALRLDRYREIHDHLTRGGSGEVRIEIESQQEPGGE